eukprot:scaffold180337_cov30-Tisochrysis_lutea.AAC.2
MLIRFSTCAGCWVMVMTIGRFSPACRNLESVRARAQAVNGAQSNHHATTTYAHKQALKDGIGTACVTWGGSLPLPSGGTHGHGGCAC